MTTLEHTPAGPWFVYMHGYDDGRHLTPVSLTFHGEKPVFEESREYFAFEDARSYRDALRVADAYADLIERNQHQFLRDNIYVGNLHGRPIKVTDRRQTDWRGALAEKLAEL